VNQNTITKHQRSLRCQVSKKHRCERITTKYTKWPDTAIGTYLRTRLHDNVRRDDAIGSNLYTFANDTPGAQSYVVGNTRGRVNNRPGIHYTLAATHGQTSSCIITMQVMSAEQASSSSTWAWQWNFITPRRSARNSLRMCS